MTVMDDSVTNDLEGTVSVVTGGASGIGRGLALALADAGSHVIVADADETRAHAVASELRERGVDSLAVVCDVSDRDAVEALAAQAWDTFGHVELVANNAGVIAPMVRTLDVREADARWVLDVNLMGVWYGCVAFGRRFVEQGTRARIVNTASEHGLGLPHPRAAFYTASKHAIIGLSDVLRAELPEFVSVSVLCPGMVSTDIAHSLERRPARFGGPVEVDAPPVPGMDPEEYGRRALEGVLRGDFYVVTHPPVRELVEERTAELLAAFDAYAPRYPGDEALDSRAYAASMTKARRGR